MRPHRCGPKRRRRCRRRSPVAAIRPRSTAGAARRGKRVERARSAVAALVDAPPEGVVFVSGGTEANHLALVGGAGANACSFLPSSTIRFSGRAPEAERIPVDRNGIVGLDALDRLLAADPRPALVSVMLANNETGVVQPVSARSPRSRGPMAHCFIATPCRPPERSPSTFTRIGADLVSLSAHKLGGPPGVGALVVTGGLELMPLLRGGGQERGRRAGTENLPGIAGFAAAAAAAAREIAVYDRVRALRDALEAGVAEVAPEAVVLGAGAPRLPNTAAIAMPGVAAETQVIALDLDGVMVSAGAACSSGKVGPSHVLEAMGVGARARHFDDPGQPRLELDRGRYRALPAGLERALSALPRFCPGGARGMSEPRRPNAMPIYLDNQSSTRLDPRVLEAMLPYFTEQFGNPHSTSHRLWPDRCRGDRRGAQQRRGTDPRRSARDRVHLGRHRIEQSGDQGCRAFRPRPSAERASPAITS